jgi:acetylornithine/succinyldiaminopimelate/putrescine aminotransferase
MDRARKVFSSALVDGLTRVGMDFLEGDSRGAFILDRAGNRYLDAYASGASCNLGRRPEALAKALESAAMETDQGNFVLISEEKALLAEKLAEFMPDHLGCCYFTVVRGEAMEAACKLARGRTGRPKLAAVEGAWHGDTGFALSLSQHAQKHLFEPLIPGVVTMPLGDHAAVERVVTEETAAAVVETVQVENGCRAADPEYLRTVQRQCRRVGALLIVDETQTGFGRTGKRFSIEHSGIQPDILVFGEAICGGMFNLCGLSFTSSVKRFFDDHPLIHLCTFGGHDIGCRVAVAALKLYESVQPWRNAAALAHRLRTTLTGLREHHPEAIKKTVATGLLGAVVFQDTDRAAAFCRRATESGAILKQGRVDPASVIIRPPLTVSVEELGQLEKCMQRAGEAI